MNSRLRWRSLTSLDLAGDEIDASEQADGPWRLYSRRSSDARQAWAALDPARRCCAIVPIRRILIRERHQPQAATPPYLNLTPGSWGIKTSEVIPPL